MSEIQAELERMGAEKVDMTPQQTAQKPEVKEIDPSMVKEKEPEKAEEPTKTETKDTEDKGVQSSEEKQETEKPKNGEEKTDPTEQNEAKTDVSTPQFDVSSLKTLGIEVEDADTLKSAWEKAQKLPEYEEKLSKYESDYNALKEEIDTYKTYVDPKTYFANETELKRNIILKTFPDKNPDIINRIMDFKHEGSVESSIEAAALNEMLSTPNFVGDVDVAKEIVMKDLGIEVEDLSELSQADKNRIQRAANNAVKNFNELKNVQVPEAFDYEKRKQELQAQKQELEAKRMEAWAKPIELMTEKFDKVPMKFKVDGQDISVDMVVDSEFKSEYANKMREIAKTKDYNQENIQAIGQQMMNEYVTKNINKIVQAAADKVTALKEEEFHKENHVDTPTNTATKPKDSQETKLVDLDELKKNRQSKVDNKKYF